MKGKTENHPGTDLKDHHQISIVKYLAVAIAMISIPMGYWREVGGRTLDQLQILALQLSSWVTLSYYLIWALVSFISELKRIKIRVRVSKIFFQNIFISSTIIVY